MRRLEPLGNGNEEPVFVAYNVAPRRSGANHQGPACTPATRPRRTRRQFSALGWDWAARIQALGLEEGSVVHLAYRLNENEHPSFGGLELEIADVVPAS